MGEAIVFTSGKGGVGKTTTIANIGAGLSQLDKKVVMLDADMGLRNLDVVMGMEDRITYNLFDILENHCRLNQAFIRDRKYPNLYMIPASLKYRDVTGYEDRLLTLICELKKEFDYCLIDCMPSLGILTVASLVAADRVLIPVQAQHFALKGVVSLFKSINQITRRIKPELEIDGIVLTMVDRRTNLSKDVCAALRSSYGHALKIYRTEIPVSTRTAESASSAHSVLRYDASGPASIAYKTLAKEVVENERVRQQHHTSLAR